MVPTARNMETGKPGRRVNLRPAFGNCLNVTLCLSLALAGSFGCRPEPRSATDSATPDGPAAAATVGVRTEKELGPVRVRVEVAPAPARLSDEPTLTVTVSATAGTDVELPPFGEAIGQFVVLDFREPLVEVRGDREIRRQIYTLEAPRTGMLEIDPITVSFTAPGSGGERRRQSLETEALAVEVVSLLDSEAPSLDALQGPAPPVELPRKVFAWTWMVGGAVLAGGLIVLFVWAFRRRATARLEPPPSPREIAASELDRIWREELHLQDVKLFYAELTGVVRRYIEGTTGVHAPEQTTEEFLREIGGGQVFSEDERLRLQRFLESADLVKFAAYQPAGEDRQEAFARARAFVGIDGATARPVAVDRQGAADHQGAANG